MPRPIAAGVLGMARTTTAALPRPRALGRIEQRRGDRVARRRAAPPGQLAGRVDARALAERDVDEILDLLDAGAERSAQQHGMAESRRIVVRGEIEMAEPQLLVDR